MIFQLCTLKKSNVGTVLFQEKPLFFISNLQDLETNENYWLTLIAKNKQHKKKQQLTSMNRTTIRFYNIKEKLFFF
jgi:hypothetical protein